MLSDHIDIELKMDRQCYASIIRGTQIFLWHIKLSSVEIRGIYVWHDMDISLGLYTVSGRVYARYICSSFLFKIFFI